MKRLFLLATLSIALVISRGIARNRRGRRFRARGGLSKRRSAAPAAHDPFGGGPT